MFEIFQNGNNTQVKTNAGLFTIRYSTEHRRYQVFKPGSNFVFRESYSGFQGALNIVNQLVD